MVGRMLMSLTVVLGVAGPVAGQDLSQMAREVIGRSGDAIITIEVVTEQSYSWGGSTHTGEEKSEALGIVVSATGTVVTALSSVDSAQMYERLSGGREDMNFTSTVKGIKFILADETEIPATVALRDVDLDLAVLVPKGALEKPMTKLGLESPPAPEILDRVFTVARMGKIARRTIVGMSGEIQGIVKSPRMYYIPSAELASAGTGVPIFTSEGAFLGIVLLHVLPGAISSSSSSDEPVIHVVVPVADVRAIVEQVPAAGAAEATDAAAPAEATN